MESSSTTSPKLSLKTPITSAAAKRTSPSKTRGSLIPQDKGAVILDIGHAYTRVGMSGEPAPRHIIKSIVAMRPYGEVLNVWDRKYIKRDELYLIMCRFLSNIYLKHLLVNPREHRVVIVESLVAPSHFRNTLAKALFHHFQVPHVCFLPLHLSCLFTLGLSTSLIVDVGYKETTVLPVYEGVAVVNAWQVTETAVEAFHRNLLELLKESGSVKDVKTGLPVSVAECKELSESDTIPNMAVKTCFVRPLSRGDQLPLDVQYPLNPINMLTIGGKIRSHACDCFFQSADDLSIPECILNSLLKCPIDCRRGVSENVLIVGGGAGLPGFNYRLKEELDRKLSSDSQYSSLKSLNFKFHKPISNPNYTAWQGGSLFGSFETAVLERSVSKETFKQKNRLPEWMSCDPEAWESVQTLPTRKLPTSSSSIASTFSSLSGIKRDLPSVGSKTTTQQQTT